MRKIFLLLCIGFVLSVGLASASISVPTNVSYFTNDSATGTAGVLYVPNVNQTIIGFSKNTINTQQGCGVSDDQNVTLAGGSYTGLYCALSNNVTLVAGRTYRLYSNSTTVVSERYTYNNTFYLDPGFPSFNLLGNYTGGCFGNVTVEQCVIQTFNSTIYNIENISVTNYTRVYLRGPSNGASSSSATVLFNSTIIPDSPNNIINATLYLWHSNGSLARTSSNSTGQSSITDFSLNVSNLLADNYLWNVLGCFNDACSFAPNNRSFIFGYTENSRTYNATTYETATENFILNVTLSSGVTLSSATFYYNNTAYTATTSNEAGATYLVQRAVSAPGVTGVTNITLFWSLLLSNGVSLNTTTSNQTVTDIIFVPCNATYTTVALNFTIFEEGLNTILNASLETAYQFYLDGSSSSVYALLTFANTSENRSNYQFCISPPSLNLRVTGPTSYYKTGYDRREYWFVNALVNNVTQNIPLYLLSTSASDVVTITVLDQSGNPVPGAYVFVQRWDIGTDSFSTVGVVPTSSAGTGLINLRLNDAWYRFTVVYNGLTYLITNPEKLGTASKQLTINLIETSPYNTFNNVSHTLTFNNVSNSFTFLFNDPTGAVAQGCLRVSKVQGNGSLLLDYSCLTTTAGSLSYTTTENGTFIAIGSLILNSNYSSVAQDVDTLVKTIGIEARFTTIRTFGQVISFVMIGTAGFFGVVSGSLPLGLGLILAVSFFVYKLGWLNIAPAVIWSIIAIVIMIAITLRRRFQQ